MCEREFERRESEVRDRSPENRVEDEDGWQQHKRRTRSRNNPPNITSFFVYNLPPSMNSQNLKTLFQHLGNMTDAYIAKKKDKYGNPFGFIRFKNVQNVQTLLPSLQKIKHEGLVISVHLAKVDKQGNPTPHAKLEHNKPQHPINPKNPYQPPPINPYHYQPSSYNYLRPPFTSSFKDKLETPPPPPILSVKLPLANPKTPNVWKRTSIIATFKDYHTLTNPSPLMLDPSYDP